MAYFTTRDGCSLYYETVGFDFARPSVIFLNGTMQTTIYWKAVASSLQPAFCSLLYDARGQGGSDLGEKELSLDLHLEDLLELMRHLDLRQVYLVGLSHGARLAYAMSCKKPELVQRVVLCATGLRASLRARLIVRSWLPIIKGAGIEALVNASIPHFFGERYLFQNQKIIGRIAATIIRRNRTSSLMAHLSAMAGYPRLSTMVQKLDMPALVMSGTDDLLVNPDGAAELAARSGGRYLAVKGAGHSIPVEAPKRFVKILMEFMSGRGTDMPEGI